MSGKNRIITRGNKILTKNNKIVTGCIRYFYAYKCSDDTLTSPTIGMLVSDVIGSSVYAFKYLGVCYYFKGPTTTVAPATILTPAMVTIYECCSKCASGACCGGCKTGLPPATFQLIIAGVLPCPCARVFIPGEGAFFDYKWTSGDINGIFCAYLERSYPSGSQCTWNYPLPDPPVITYYDSSDGSCSGSVVGTETRGLVRVQVTIIVIGGTPNYAISIQDLGTAYTGVGLSLIGAGSRFINAGASSPTLDNCSAGTYTNLYTLAGYCGAGVRGYNGTAGLIPNVACD